MAGELWYDENMQMKERVLSWVERRIRTPIAGLDISDRSIKYAQFVESLEAPRGADFKKRPIALRWGEEEIAEGAMTEGAVLHEEAVVDALRRLAERAGRAFRSSGMAVSLPEEKSFLRIFQLPNVAAAEMAGAIRWGIEGQIPLAAEDTAYGYEAIEPLDGHPDHRDAVVTAFPKTIIASYVRAIKNAGLAPVALELESQAIVRAVAPDLRSREAHILIDMGRTRTSFILFVGGAIVLTTTVPVGGQKFEDDIAHALGVDAKEAARLKKEIGLARHAEEGNVTKALMPSLTIFAEELRRAIAYYQDHGTHVHGGSPAVQKILLSGGDANLFGLDTYLASALRMPVVRADPFAAVRDTMAGAVPPIPRKQALAFTAAIGLALRGVRQRI